MKLVWLPEGGDKRYCLFLIKDGVRIKIIDPKYEETRTMAKYRKKPVVIEAVQFNGEMTNELKSFLKEAKYIFHDFPGIGGCCIELETLEGTMRANILDYIIRGVNGEYYPCKPDIFEKTYEKAEE